MGDLLYYVLLIGNLALGFSSFAKGDVFWAFASLTVAVFMAVTAWATRRRGLDLL